MAAEFTKIKILENDIARNGSRTISPEENCPPTPILSLTLTQRLTLNGGQFSSGVIACTPFQRQAP